MSYEIMEIVALKAAGWALVLDEGEPRFSTDCYGNKYFLYAFTHSATGQVMRVKVRRGKYQIYDAKGYETEAYERAFEMLLGN